MVLSGEAGSRRVALGPGGREDYAILGCRVHNVSQAGRQADSERCKGLGALSRDTVDTLASGQVPHGAPRGSQALRASVRWVSASGQLPAQWEPWPWIASRV